MNAGFAQDWEYELGGYDPEAVDISSQFAVTVLFYLEILLGFICRWSMWVMLHLGTAL
jgi:hypothetical protein